MAKICWALTAWMILLPYNICYISNVYYTLCICYLYVTDIKKLCYLIFAAILNKGVIIIRIFKLRATCF